MVEKYAASLLEMISQREQIARFVLTIDGLSRSGKTTLVHKLSHMAKQKKVPICVFHMDDFIVERNRRYETCQQAWYEYYHLQWDVEWLKEHLFNKLKQSSKLDLPYYDNESDTHRMHSIFIPDSCVILVEGIFLQRHQWREFYDYVAYLDCPRPIRFSRESDSTQQQIEKFKNRYWKAEDYYLEIEAPMKRADLVLKYDAQEECT